MNKDILDAPFQDRESDFNHHFGSYFPKVLIIVGAVMILGGLYSLVNLNFIGVVLILIGLVLVFSKHGTGFNFSSHTYRDYISLFGMAKGTWKNIPNCEYISVFSAIESQSINTRINSADIKHKVIFVNLIHSRNQRLSVFKTDNLEEAFKVAHFFSDKLKLDIFDATNQEKNWILREGSN